MRLGKLDAKLRKGGFIAIHSARPTENSPEGRGSMEFFEREVTPCLAVELIDGIDSLYPGVQGSE
jgi:hypothetical protein